MTEEEQQIEAMKAFRKLAGKDKETTAGFLFTVGTICLVIGIIAYLLGCVPREVRDFNKQAPCDREDCGREIGMKYRASP